MKILTLRRSFSTKGQGDFIDITTQAQEALAESGLSKGLAHIFLAGSTAAITAFEYEPGMLTDMREFYERMAPADRHYAHNETWNDANGFSHVRAAAQGPGMSVPFSEGKLLLGTWQQLVVAEFDTRARQREIIITLMGE